MVGGEHEQVVGTEDLKPRLHRAVDLLQRPVETRHVVAMAVDLIGLDQVREHQPALERGDQLPVWAIARALSAPGCSASTPRPANSCPTFPTVWTSTPAVRSWSG